MLAWLHHWIWVDLYVPVWPNIAASLALAIWVGFRLHVLRKLHLALHDLQHQHHREHMEAIRQITPNEIPPEDA